MENRECILEIYFWTFPKMYQNFEMPVYSLKPLDSRNSLRTKTDEGGKNYGTIFSTGINTCILFNSVRKSLRSCGFYDSHL